jgi:putative isomerase
VRNTRILVVGQRSAALFAVFALGLLGAAQTPAPSRLAPDSAPAPPRSPAYAQVQQRLAQGWNTWDVDSVTTQVLLPEGVAIHVGMKHNSTGFGDAYLQDALIGRLGRGDEQVTPGPHAWDGSYTDLRVAWHGHAWRVQSAHAGGRDLVMLVSPLSSDSALPPTVVVSVDLLWNHAGLVVPHGDSLELPLNPDDITVYCTCVGPEANRQHNLIDIPTGSFYFAADLTVPVGISTGKRRGVAEIVAILADAEQKYEESVTVAGTKSQLLDAIQTTLGWDTIYEPSRDRVISPVSRVWSVAWGGYVLFDWDTFFAATLASIGDRDLAYANALEILREETPVGFVPNYARAGGWKSSDRSEPPVGAITVLGLYQKFHDRWFLEDAFAPLLSWNRWWDEHRQMQGYLAWGSDGDNQPENLDDHTRGTRVGAILESGLDNSPMYDSAVYDPKTHLLEFADVGLMSLYIADCDALAQIAHELGRNDEEKELSGRAARYREKLATLWDPQAGIFLNKDLHTGQFSTRLSPTNFYPLLARAATPEQAHAMIEKHLLNPQEFDGPWVIPSIARDDPAFHDQNYWRGRIWGPMNYLVYLGLRNYDDTAVRRDFAQKSAGLFFGEWRDRGHVHENYNAISGAGDDVTSSDRFYHWGALLGYIEYLEQGGAQN